MRIKNRMLATVLVLCIAITNVMQSFADPTEKVIPLLEEFLEGAASEKRTPSDAEVPKMIIPEPATPSNALEEPVTFLFWDDTKKELAESSCTEYTVIDSNTAEPEDGYLFESEKWYVVKDNVTFNNRIQNSASKDAPAHLILADGCNFKVPKGISNTKNHALEIFACTDDPDSAGAITIDAALTAADIAGYSGIGGDLSEAEDLSVCSSGTLTISGGNIVVYGSNRAAGLGGGMNGNGGDITINGGFIMAQAGYDGAGIGGGLRGVSGTITINGGTVDARGRRYSTNSSCGIGPGSAIWNALETPPSSITINGGTVTATGATSGAGIGNVSGSSSQIVITDGIVTATGGSFAAGIGGIYGASGGEITISGGTVTATGGKDAAGIGSGKRYREDDAIDGGTISITGGTIVAIGTPDSSGLKPAGIGGGFDCEDHGTLFIDEEILEVYGGTSESDARFMHADAYGFARSAYVRITETPEYTVNHLQQTVDGLSYGLYDSDTLHGNTGFKTLAVANVYDGFSSQPFEQKTVLSDGSTVVEIKYDRNTYTLRFAENGHGIAPESVTAVYGAEITEPAEPKATGYFFDGWYTDPECTASFTFDKMPSGNLTLFAKWTPLTYTITWRDGETTLRKDTVTTGTLPQYDAPLKPGFAFTGWHPAVVIAEADATYTATYQRNIEGYHVVTFDTQGGTAISAKVIEDGESVPQPENPKRSGYIFAGWYTDTTFGTVFDFSSAITADTTVCAKWTENEKPKYMITWLIGDSSDTTQVTEGEMPTHSDPSREGYIFLGWNPALAPVTGDITYTAKFEQRTPEKAAVTFNTSGGNFIETQVVTKGQKAVRPSDPVKTGYSFVNWYADAAFTASYDFNTAVSADITLFAKWQKNAGKEYTITWKDWNGNVLASQKVSEGGLPKYPGAVKPSRSGYIFTGWTPEIDLATADKTYTATYVKTSGSGGGGGGTVSTTVKATPTFSPNWYSDELGVWRIRNSAGQAVVNAWLCDDVIKANGQNVWYLLREDGAMIANGLVQDKTGNFYSLETEHNGYFGMLRYQNGTYNCNGQQVYLTFNHEHNGSFGAITNAEGLEKLKAIYGVTQYGIGNENAVYTATF